MWIYLNKLQRNKWAELSVKATISQLLLQASSFRDCGLKSGSSSIRKILAQVFGPVSTPTESETLETKPRKQSLCLCICLCLCLTPRPPLSVSLSPVLGIEFGLSCIHVFFFKHFFKKLIQGLKKLTRWLQCMQINVKKHWLRPKGCTFHLSKRSTWYPVYS